MIAQIRDAFSPEELRTLIHVADSSEHGGEDLLRIGGGQFVQGAPQGTTTVTTQIAVAWATKSKESINWRAARLDVVRGFARYLQAIDPSTDVPPARLLPRGNHRAMPYIYYDAEISSLMAAAQTLRSRIRRCTYGTLIGLLAATGMRPGEAVHLDRDDANWKHAVLTVRHAKFGKSREVALHTTTLAALEPYKRCRDELIPHPNNPSFFVSPEGTRLTHDDVGRTFRRLVCRGGLPRISPRCRPRLHDFRHYALAAFMRSGPLNSRPSTLSAHYPVT